MVKKMLTTRKPDEKPLGARIRKNKKLNQDMTTRPGIKPGRNWWEASDPTTARVPV